VAGVVEAAGAERREFDRLSGESGLGDGLAEAGHRPGGGQITGGQLDPRDVAEVTRTGPV
jgi:hypothetical protein